jgi:SAM-dependent methyltransferase
MSDHRATMEALARERGWQRGVELGLGHGLLFARFLALGIEMVGVDLGLRPERRKAVEALNGGKVHWMATAEAAPLVPDGWADFVFVDAGHSYVACRQDIANWLRKVRPGGWFGGYHPKFAGVMRAVDEAFGEAVDHLPGHVWARRC